jgi:hypothetical protein
MDASMEQARYVIHHAWDYSEFIARFIRDDKGINYSLSNYLKLFGVDFEGQKHDALADAYNLIDLYKAFLAKPEIVMREYEKTLGLSRNHFPEPVRQVMAKLSQGETVTPEEYEEVYRQKVLPQHIDMSHHMNNIEYVKLALNVFSAEDLELCIPSMLEVHFMGETHEGQEVTIFRADKMGATYMKIEDDMGRQVFEMKIKMK